MSCEPAASANGGGGGGASADSSGAAERAVEDVKPQELLCGKCSASVGGTDCPEHGQVCTKELYTALAIRWSFLSATLDISLYVTRWMPGIH